MDVLWGYSLQGRVWVFIGFQWVLIGAQFLAQAIVPDVPEEVEIQIQRNEFINDKVIEKVEDEDFGQTFETEEMVDDEEVTGQKKKNCLCFRLGGGSKSKKIPENNPVLPTFSYPFQQDPTLWPKALNNNDPRYASGSTTASVEEVKPQFNIESYTSPLAAVSGAPSEPAAKYY